MKDTILKMGARCLSLVGLTTVLVLGSKSETVASDKSQAKTETITFYFRPTVRPEMPTIQLHEQILVGDSTEVNELLPALEPTTYIKQEYVDICIEVANRYELEPELLVAMIEAESSGDRFAVSKVGALGLMQIYPKFHKSRMSRLGISDLYDPWQNIECGADYISSIYNSCQDMTASLICYNSGAGSKAYKDAIKYGKSTQYADKIMYRYNELKQKGLKGE